MITYIIAIFVIAVLAIYFVATECSRKEEPCIAIVEFGEKVTDNDLVQWVTQEFPIHWYVYYEKLTDTEKELEIQDLKEHYELILEVK